MALQDSSSPSRSLLLWSILSESQDDEAPGPVVPYSGTRCPFCSDRGNFDFEGRNQLLQRPWKIISFVARSRTTSETRLTTYWNLQRRDSMSNCGMLRNQRSLWILSCWMRRRELHLQVWFQGRVRTVWDTRSTELSLKCLLFWVWVRWPLNS